MGFQRLILMRHATAGGAGEGGDINRPLTASGLAEAARVGKRLTDEGYDLAQVHCSTARRCRETLQEIVRAFEETKPIADEAIFFDSKLYNAPDASILQVLAGVVAPEEQVSGTFDVLLVAHNPGISQLAHAVGRHDPEAQACLRAGFAPGMTAIFEVEPPWATFSKRPARLIDFQEP